MPWINEEMCTGCGECVEECPTGAISIVEEKAVILMEECIRCAACHDICPEEAIRHDGEKIPIDVKTNVEKTKACMEACTKHFGNAEEAEKCLNRFIKHYMIEKTIAEKTIEEIQLLHEATPLE